MNTELKNAIASTDKDAQYDASAKRILAHILVKTVPEFMGMNPKDIVPLIEGEPCISTVPVEPGLTNTVTENSGERLIGLNGENAEINEGLIRFDIIFYVRMPSKSGIKGELSQIIVNVEAQKSEPTEYDILNRAIFYVSRMISSQKGRDFENSNYNDIRRVYSIWVCMNMDKNSMSHIHLTKDDIIDTYHWKGNLDLLNIVMLGLTKELPEHDEMYELHRLLGALLSKELTINEKLTIIGDEYNIPVEENFRRDVNIMCNLSQGIREDGIAEGEARIILNMHKNGLTAEQIATYTGTSVDDVIAIIETDKKAVLV